MREVSATTTEQTAATGRRAGAVAVLAGLCVAAGLVHLALAPAHVAEWPLEGRAFALLAVAQLAVAVALLARPSRDALVVAAAVHLVAVAGWTWSRTAGLPAGPSPGVAEDVGWLDAVTAAGEVAAVALAAGLLWATRAEGRPTPPADAGDGPLRLTRPLRLGPVPRWGSAGAALVAVAAVALVASPAGQHSHGDADGHDHGAGGEDAALAAPLPVDVQDELGAQLALAREVAMALPTVADAEEAGLLRAGNFFPGSAAHYVDIERGMATDFDLERPLAWLYAGTDPDSRLVGVMYYSATDAEPEGFAGPLDTWHQHAGACYRLEPGGGITVPFSPDVGVTEEECTAVEGAEYIDQTGWMVHAWVVPGWDSPLGVFSHDNPHVLCADGRAQVDDIAEGCPGT